MKLIPRSNLLLGELGIAEITFRDDVCFLLQHPFVGKGQRDSSLGTLREMEEKYNTLL
jgi:hypothetical protein